MNNYLYPPEPGPSAWEQIQQIIVSVLAVFGIFSAGILAWLWLHDRLTYLAALL